MDTKHQQRKSWFVLAGCTVAAGLAWTVPHIYRFNPSPAACFDLRADKSTNDYSVIVSSRDADALSHAFVSWIHHPQDSDQERKMWGFYARADNSYQAVLAPAGELLDEGKILEEFSIDGTLTQRVTRTAIVFWLDEDTFHASYKVIKNWQPGKNYALLSNDCVTVVANIFEHFGLILPPRMYAPRPHDFLWAVIELNSSETHPCRRD